MDPSQPITLEQFTLAIQDLPVDALRSEKSRLENSVAHLKRSNAEIATLLETDNDEELKTAIQENEHVIEQQELRIAALVDQLPVHQVEEQVEGVHL